MGNESVDLVGRGTAAPRWARPGGGRGRTMFVPAEHGLPLAPLLRQPSTGVMPFPLSAPRPLYFYRARNAIYHTFRALKFDRGDTVLMPDYHNTNEVAAVRASGA